MDEAVEDFLGFQNLSYSFLVLSFPVLINFKLFILLHKFLSYL